jgi:hypothetical protein
MLKTPLGRKAPDVFSKLKNSEIRLPGIRIPGHWGRGIQK